MPLTVTRTTVQTVGSHQSPNKWPWGVTKGSLKVTITTTTARNNREVCIWPPNTNIRYMKKIWHTCVILFIIWELLGINFTIGGVVVGTTPMAILRTIRLHLDVFTMTDEFKLHHHVLKTNLSKKKKKKNLLNPLWYFPQGGTSHSSQIPPPTK